jgi:hypothetical protein
MMVRKRTGVFNTGDSDYRVAGHFILKLDENRGTVVEAVLDNMPHVNETRTLDALDISDKLLVVIDGTDKVETSLFNGLITQIIYDRATTTLKVTAQDTSFIGQSAIMNDILHQKYVDSFETTLDESETGEFTATLPADTDTAAPITVQNRVAYGNPLRTMFNNKTALDADYVYATPSYIESTYTFRGVSAMPNSVDGAKKYVAQTFTVKRDTQLTNIFFPIAQYQRLYPGEIAETGEWLNVGTDALYNVLDVPTGADIDTINFSMPHTRMGPPNKLRVSLVKCVRTSGAEAIADRKTVTKSARDVETGAMVPSYGAPGDEQLSYYDGTFFGESVDEISRDKEETIVLATIEISPTEPIQSPHEPAGEIPKITHTWGVLHDDAQPTNNEAYTMFGWNLESNPISVAGGDILALVFEQLGRRDHPKLTDGVEPTDKSNPDGYLSPSNFWAVGIGRKLDGTGITETNVYPGGSYMMSALTDLDLTTNPMRTLVGTHSMEQYKPTLDSNSIGPGYNGLSDAGIWEYNDKINLMSDMANWNNALAGAMNALEATINFINDPAGVFEDEEFVHPGDLPDSLQTGGLFKGMHDLSSMYFTVVTGNWLRLGRGLYWDVDEAGKINFNYGSADWTPFSSNRFGLKMARMSLYENPATGGLLDANAKSSVYDVATAIVEKIPKWNSIIIDGMLDGIDDVEGSGYNDPANWPLSYWAMHEESAWASLQRLAIESEASMRVQTGMNDITTVLFEKRIPVRDFAYTSPAAREYTFSTRPEDPNWMKHVVSSRIERDIETMYTKFRVIGKKSEGISEAHYSIGLPLGQDQPIIFELNVPENEEKLGFERVKEFKSSSTITTHEQALTVANAAKTLYANDTFSGIVELSGLHPLYEHSTLGLMLDMNSIIRLIDDGSPSGSAVSGTDNVFRVTGINYNSREHKTDLTISTSVINREVMDAKSILDNLNKKTTTDESKHLVRLAHDTFFTLDINIPYDYTEGTLEVFLDSSNGGGPIVSDAIQAKLLLDQGMDKVAGSTGHIIAVFMPGTATIENDTEPWIFGEIGYSTTTSALAGTTEPNILFTMPSAYKYSTDTLTVIVPVTLV